MQEMVTIGGRDGREKAQESQKTPDTREPLNLPTTFTPGILLRILRLFAVNPSLRSALPSNFDYATNGSCIEPKVTD